MIWNACGGLVAKNVMLHIQSICHLWLKPDFAILHEKLYFVNNSIALIV